jgi:hypothetical protein
MISTSKTINNKSISKEIINILLFLTIIMDFSYPFNFNGVFFIIAFFIILFFYIELNLNNFYLKKYLLPVFFLMLFVNNSIDSIPYIFVILYAYLLRNVNIKKMICFCIFFRLLFICITLFLLYNEYVSDLLTDVNWKNISIIYNLNISKIHTLGFSKNPNTTSLNFFSLIILLYILAKLSNNLYISIIINTFNFFLIVIIYIFTGSRTFFYSEILLYLISLIVYRKKNIFATMSLLIPVIGFIFTLILTMYFGNNTFINILLAGRPRLFNLAFNSITPIKLLIGSDYKGITIDSSYMKIFFQTGIIGTAYFLYIYIVFLKHILSDTKIWEKYYLYIPVIAAISCAGIFESILVSIKDIIILFYILVFSVYNYKPIKIKIPEYVSSENIIINYNVI